MRRLAISVLESVRSPAASPDEAWQLQQNLQKELEKKYDMVKTQLLKAGTTGSITARHMVSLIELMKNIERLTSYNVKGQSALYHFAKSLTPADEADKEPEKKGQSE